VHVPKGKAAPPRYKAATVTSATAPSDIIGTTRDVALGEGWFALESHRGQRFRWAKESASIYVAVLDSAQALLRLVVEPGPGLGAAPLKLEARLPDGTVLGTATVVTKQPVTFALPPEHPRAYVVQLQADGGGKSLSTDSRILNFRAFEVGVERRVDVLPSWAVPGKGFYALERLGGDTFRWVSNDAVISLHPARGDRLSFDVEPGPGVGSKAFTLSVRDGTGKELAAENIASRTTIDLALAGLQGDRIVLHTGDGGETVKTDPRELNFRIFAVER
jgi:hypothetical protein